MYQNRSTFKAKSSIRTSVLKMVKWTKHKSIILSCLICVTDINHISAATSKGKIHPRALLLKENKEQKQKAILYAMIIPCSGQLYNHNYWEAGIFAGLFGLSIWWTIWWDNEYVRYGRQSRDSSSNTINKSSYDSNIIMSKRNRDIGFIVMGTIYILSIVQAYVEASMMTFDVSDNLHFVMNPTITDDKPGVNLGVTINP